MGTGNITHILLVDLFVGTKVKKEENKLTLQPLPY